jgi:type IV pilus assembly protein PilX
MDDTHMFVSQVSVAKRRTSRGVSLIIVLIMMIIIGITAATAMRNATSEQRATNNQRVEATALQYAEAALRFCESEMVKQPDTLRVSTLRNVNIATTSFGPTTSGWEDTATWTGLTGRSSASRTTVPNPRIQDNASETVLPTKNPECIVENMTGYGVVVTARGFSPDYAADSNGYTTSGAVVWLQSITN